MGQNASCIHGNPDWIGGSYEKASAKNSPSPSSLEWSAPRYADLLKPSAAESAPKNLALDAVFRKEVHCKAVNFDDDAPKSTCRVHGSSKKTAAPAYRHPPPASTGQQEIVQVLASIGVHSAKERIQQLEDRAEVIVETFGMVLKHLEHGDWSNFCLGTSTLCDNIRKVISDYHLESEIQNYSQLKIKSHINVAINQLASNILSLDTSCPVAAQQEILLPSFKILGEVLHEMMEFLISKELKVLVQCVNQETSQSSTSLAICTLAEMALSGHLMCKLIVQAGTVNSLINICKNSTFHHLWPLAIRTLTLICSFKEAIVQFEELSGMDMIFKIISQDSNDKVSYEIVALLAQVLKQWSENNFSITYKIGHYLNKLVNYLIEITKKALSPEIYLLSAACLATLSKCDTNANNWSKRHTQEMQLLASSTKQESYV